MKAKRPLSGPFSLELSRYLGRRRYADAIRYLNEYLAQYPDDVSGWAFLAQCHVWEGSKRSAVDAALTALKLNPNDFDALRLLSVIYAEENEHDQAAVVIRRGLENYPEPTVGIPAFLVRAFRLFALLLPKRIRVSIEADLPELQDPNITSKRWYFWAKEYLRWHDASTGDNRAPVLH